MTEKAATTGERIKAIRGGTSQAEFGKLLDSSQGAVSAWERDDTERSPSAAIYFRLAALAHDPEDSIFFLERAGLQPDAVISVAETLLKKGEVKMDGILATAEEKLRARVGDSKMFETEGKIVLVPPFTEGEWKHQASRPPLELPAGCVPNKGSTYYVVAYPPSEFDARRRGFVPGEIIVFDAEGAPAQGFQGSRGKEVIVNFEKVGKPAWPEGLLVGRADIHPEGILVHMVLGPFDVPQYNWRLEETIILLTFRPEVYMPADLRERPRYDTPEGAKWERARRAAQSDAIARSVFPEGCQLLGRVIARFTAEPSKIWKWSW